MSKHLFFLCLMIFCLCNLQAQDQIVTLSNGRKVILHSDFTWEYQKAIEYNFNFSTLKDNKIPKFLRQGIAVKRSTLVAATEMYLQGWRYTMPRPKSSQARWGNGDGRTTWYSGYWLNQKTQKYSGTTPKKHKDGYYYGDKQRTTGWSNGGSPSYPTKIQWLLSKRGGVKPR